MNKKTVGFPTAFVCRLSLRFTSHVVSSGDDGAEPTLPKHVVEVEYKIEVQDRAILAGSTPVDRTCIRLVDRQRSLV